MKIKPSQPKAWAELANFLVEEQLFPFVGSLVSPKYGTFCPKTQGFINRAGNPTGVRLPPCYNGSSKLENCQSPPESTEFLHICMRVSISNITFDTIKSTSV